MVIRWFIARHGARVGPFSSRELVQMARFGLLDRDEWVWAHGTSKWVVATAIPGLFPKAGQKQYFVLIAGQARGPYVTDQIRAGLKTGRYSQDMQACIPGAKEWVSLSEFPEFRSTKTSSLSQSQAQLLVGSLELEEARMHIEGKEGDQIAKLISTLKDLQRAYSGNEPLVDRLEDSIQFLQKRRATK